MLDETQAAVLELAAKGYSCAQIVVLLGLRVMGRENPDLTRAMAGLAMGAGCGDICGALTGGLCLISLHTAKGMDDDRPAPMGRTLMGALIKWFKFEELKGETKIDCLHIFEKSGRQYDLNANPAESCGDLVIHTWQKVMYLLSENNIDPTMGQAES
ncbi:MAG: C-GCAxxG-C-C family protein [Deltaproteobacteria bacterium]|jgi:hypothetical protein|nr:C-GCAxxG-C-C family protein [Deltaproteobacteria bacterium]